MSVIVVAQLPSPKRLLKSTFLGKKFWIYDWAFQLPLNIEKFPLNIDFGSVALLYFRTTL